MARRKSSRRSKAKTILRLPDLEQSKNAVLHSLAATSSQESYGHAIDEFIGWRHDCVDLQDVLLGGGSGVGGFRLRLSGTQARVYAN